MTSEPVPPYRSPAWWASLAEALDALADTYTKPTAWERGCKSLFSHAAQLCRLRAGSAS